MNNESGLEIRSDGRISCVYELAVIVGKLLACIEENLLILLNRILICKRQF